MKLTLFCRVSLFLGLLFASITSYGADEQSLIAILQSNASAPQKWSAAQQLRVVGSPTCIPALASLLTDERLSQAARYALEVLPYPEASAALRTALAQTSDLLKAGVIDSIGWRRDTAAVPALKPLLADEDQAVAESAAAALGRIGGNDAVSALFAALGEQQPAVEESLVKCAEQRLAANDPAGAADIYRRLLIANVPARTRMTAWRGLVLADPTERVARVVQALAGKDRLTQLAALKLLREISDRAVIEAGLKQWPTLPPDSQLALLDAQSKFGEQALPTARLASQSPDHTLRAAAWQILGDLNDLASIPALAKAAAEGQPEERETARESLARLRGPTAREALLAALENSTPGERAELLRSFGERGDRETTDTLLRYAASDALPVRQAALESITRLAPPRAIGALLDIAVKSASDTAREPVLKALYSVCEASPNKEQAGRDVVEALGKFSTAERRQVLPLLSELATPEALQAAEAASRDQDADLAKEAVRVLGQWPSAVPAEYLLELARNTQNTTLQTLALRGAIEVSGQESDLDRRLALLQQAFAAAKRPDEKRQALGQIGQVASPAALRLAEEKLNDPELGAEAALAAVSIAEKLAPTDPKLGDAVAAKVLEQVKEGDVARRAWALRIKPSSGASFLRDWVVAGPYRQPGIVGAQAVFNLAFGPERSAQSVDWKTVPPADHINLAALFPGADNCVAYLRTQITAPADTRGALLLGSDDGVKAWLNGQVVHSNNVDRGEVADQDRAPIHLKPGANELVLKISQGGGGWSVSARIVDANGKPVPDLMVERPSQAAATLAPSK